ncbi:MAG: hopanoid biosynthesis associated radical SAM protein HpnH [Planctomycetes bacterium SCN 63-9]|nr:MAG: hopanoid biosynthesis associated radical SAM protein HpnH [Planctomycetes bacterium SCN 63-9]
MRFPIPMTSRIAKYVVRKRVTRTEKFPMVLMLEPLHACNLTCTGCGRIREYTSTIKQKLSIQECLDAVDECGAPVVSICGGEPMIYPGIGELVAKIQERKKVVYLCTNGMFTRKKIDEFKPSSTFFFNIHLDGMRENHDIAVERKGVFDEAIEGIKVAKERGFLVCSNTTVYKETDMAELETLFAYLTTLGVDGFLISPAYSYSAVDVKEIFMSRDDIKTKFRAADAMFRKYRFNSSPVYLEFLQGKREMSCTAWANPTRNIKGWKGPCYLITDIHHASFENLLNDTKWEDYGYGKDPRCENCMVHVGYEASAALGVNQRLGDTFKMIKWQLM